MRDDGGELARRRPCLEGGQGARQGPQQGASLSLSLEPEHARPFTDDSHCLRQYIVKVAISPNGRHVATLGYDRVLTVYRLVLAPSSPSPTDGAPALLDGERPDPLATCPRVTLEQVHRLAARSNPEAAVWLPDSSELVWSAREDHLLHYLRVPAESGEGEGEEGGKWTESHVNLNPNGDAFVSFSMCVLPLSLSLPRSR